MSLLITEHHRLNGLKFIFSESWRLEVQDLGASNLVFPGASLLASRWLTSHCVLIGFSSEWTHPQCLGLDEDPNTTSFHLTYLSNGPISTYIVTFWSVLWAGTSTHEFGEDTIQSVTPNTWIIWLPAPRSAPVPKSTSHSVPSSPTMLKTTLSPPNSLLGREAFSLAAPHSTQNQNKAGLAGQVIKNHAD